MADILIKNRYEIIGDITLIYLFRKDGTEIKTVIDTEDFFEIAKYPQKWCSQWDRKTKSFRVITRMDNTTVYLHRLIMKPLSGMVVDHINHETLDNRRFNLRNITNAQNCQNRTKYMPYSLEARNVK